jgi:hypothetical protein
MAVTNGPASPSPSKELHSLDARLANVEYQTRQNTERLTTVITSLDTMLRGQETIQAQLDRLGGLLMMYIDQKDPPEEDEEGAEQLTTPAKNIPPLRTGNKKALHHSTDELEIGRGRQGHVPDHDTTE